MARRFKGSPSAYRVKGTLPVSLLALLILALLGKAFDVQGPGPGGAPRLNNHKPSEGIQGSGRVARVVDGDTIRLEDGTTVRYTGIDTPETVHPNKPVECMGKEASNRNKTLVAGQEVLLETDVEERDRYGRLLAYVYLSTATGKVMVNEILVQEGFATPLSIPPNVRYADRFLAANRQARERRAGLYAHGACVQ